MTSLEYYIEQIEQFISSLTDDIGSGEGTIVTQTKLSVYWEVLEHLEEIEQSKYNSIKTELNGDLISRQAVLDLAKKGVLISNGSYKSVCKAINEIPADDPQNCDKCEVGNPCLYCRHEFEPQERNEEE